MSLWLSDQTEPVSVYCCWFSKIPALVSLKFWGLFCPCWQRHPAKAGTLWCWITRAWRLGSRVLEALLVAAGSLKVGGSQNCSSEWCILLLWVTWSPAPIIMPLITFESSPAKLTWNEPLQEVLQCEAANICTCAWLYYPLLSHLLQHSQRFTFIAVCTTVSWKESPGIEQPFSW